MKLLFDENLSHKLPRLVAPTCPDSKHVREFGLRGQTDEAIWNYAKSHDFTLVSKDKDFYQRAMLYGSPPKFIWLCLGNYTRADLVALIQRHEQDIKTFETSSESIPVLK